MLALTLLYTTVVRERHNTESNRCCGIECMDLTPSPREISRCYRVVVVLSPGRLKKSPITPFSAFSVKTPSMIYIGGINHAMTASKALFFSNVWLLLFRQMAVS